MFTRSRRAVRARPPGGPGPSRRKESEPDFALHTHLLGFAALAAAQGAPEALASGKFHGVAHQTQGAATVYKLPSGKKVLRLTDFETSNGPDVQVYLVATSDAADSDTVTQAGFVNIGALKGNKGNQNYDVPDDLDLHKYRAATIWCRRFGVNFATAPLAGK